MSSIHIPPGRHVPPHAHGSSVEVYVVRRGACELVVNGQQVEIGPDDVVLMEPGDVHDLNNRGTEAFRAIAYSAAGG